MSVGVERYAMGYSDPRSLFSSVWVTKRAYGAVHKYKNKWGSPLMPKKKVDAHEYKTEAKDLPIDACASMWVIKYGDGAVNASELVEQDALIWEIGNRLFWAEMLVHDQQMDTYTCKS